ncbi:MAG: hypothetical protein Q4F95_10540 [Oscillospiraceae bacterium]|nr:hypothetical protein [Oscillospiraceae bacterium]
MDIREVKYLNACRKDIDSNTEIKELIIKSLDKLSNRILQYASQGITFDKILNDETVKYDKHGDTYTFKSHGRDNAQLRLLYSCVVTDDIMYLTVIDYHIKRRNEKKSYIVDFEYGKEIDVMALIKSAKEIEI